MTWFFFLKPNRNYDQSNITQQKNNELNMISPENQPKTKPKQDVGEMNLLIKEGIDKICGDRSLAYHT